jgi:hypothetical protein
MDVRLISKNMTNLTDEQIKEFIDRRFGLPNADSGLHMRDSDEWVEILNEFTDYVNNFHGGNRVELLYRIGSQDETRTIIQCVGGQDDVKDNRFDGKTATEGEAWNMFEKANPNAMVIKANLL